MHILRFIKKKRAFLKIFLSRNALFGDIFLLVGKLFLMLFQEVEHALKRCIRGDCKIDVATEIFGEFYHTNIVLVAEAYEDGAHWYGWCAAGRTRYACYRDGEINIQCLDGAQHHLSCHFLAVGSLLLQYLVAYAQKVLLHLVGVANHTALEVIAGTWHVQLSAVPTVLSLL